jgi:hypothetical protein
MPLYYFKCASACGREVRLILTPAQAGAENICPDCKNVLKRAPKPPTANVVETLDNGHMPRRVERPADVERLIADRTRKASTES